MAVLDATRGLPAPAAPAELLFHTSPFTRGALGAQNNQDVKGR